MNMKKYKIFRLLILLSLSLFFAGCEDFLTIEPQAKLASIDYMDDEENA
jgi:hypothetical protein